MAKAIETKPNTAEKWINALKVAEKEEKDWTTKGEKIVKRYKDERGTLGNNDKRYNILWSNIQTLMPAVYSRKPKAQCDRRYKDADPVGRTAAQILERALQYEIDHYNDYDSSIRNALKDRLLPGRGVAWVRYEPTYAAQTEQITDDTKAGSEETKPAQTVESEYSPCDYVFWKDFRHSPARTWEEVTWAARRVYMEKEEGVKRFGEDFNKVPLSHEPLGLDDKDLNATDMTKKAIVWEIWNKPNKTVYWVAENHPEILDTKADPLELDCFFPCPKPLFATLTTDSLIPVADYLQYQDQARELDDLTDRIGKLVAAVKVVGVYDATQVGIARMMTEGVDNDLIPVDNWAVFGEKGGLKGTVDWLPLDMVVGALNECYTAREQCKQVIFEVTGLSDIIRGASQASETATAQNIKSQYASLRLKTFQNDVAMFASELLNIKAQIMCRAYQPETLVEMSGIMGTQDAQFVEPAIQLLKDGTLRDFRIEVASDSLVEIDERGEQEARTQFLAAVGGFLEKAVMAPPELAPLMGEMLLFGVRGFKVGRDIENAFDEAMTKLKAPKQPAADPNAAIMQAEQMKMQQEGQMEQMRMQAEGQLEQVRLQSTQAIEQAKLQGNVQLEQIRADANAQIEQIRLQAQAQSDELTRNHEYALKQLELAQQGQELELAKYKVDKDNETKLIIAGMTAQQKADQDAANQEREANQAQEKDNGLKEVHSKTVGAIEKLTEQLGKPKRIIRGADGKAEGVE
jgi:hypothetical protein